mgnify:CR=1 FL=1
MQKTLAKLEQAQEQLEYQRLAWYSAPWGDAGIAVVVLAATGVYPVVGAALFGAVPAWVCEAIIPFAFALMGLRYLLGLGAPPTGDTH